MGNQCRNASRSMSKGDSQNDKELKLAIKATRCKGANIIPKQTKTNNQSTRRHRRKKCKMREETRKYKLRDKHQNDDTGDILDKVGTSYLLQTKTEKLQKIQNQIAHTVQTGLHCSKQRLICLGVARILSTKVCSRKSTNLRDRDLVTRHWGIWGHLHHTAGSAAHI